MKPHRNPSRWLVGLCILVAWASAGEACAGGLEAIKQRDKLVCPTVLGGFYGFSEVDDKGSWKGFDIDICKAIAVAVLGSPDKVSFNAVSWAQRFPALQSGTVDLLTSTTMTMSRDTGLGVQFTLPYFHGADQLLIKSSLGVKTGKELNGATVCMTTGTSTGQLVADYLRGLNLKYTTLAFETTSQAKEAFLAGRCDAFGGYGPVLATMRARDAKDPTAYKVLPDLIAGEPTVLVIKQNDKELLNALNYVISALLEAEDLGITSKNVEAMRNNADLGPRAKVLLGRTPFIGKQLGWRETWAYEMIKAVGNYGEIFDRNFGSQSPYKMERGLNQLWNRGGLMYPIPLL